MFEGAQRHGKARETHMNYAKRGGLHRIAQLHFGEWRQNACVSMAESPRGASQLAEKQSLLAWT